MPASESLQACQLSVLAAPGTMAGLPALEPPPDAPPLEAPFPGAADDDAGAGDPEEQAVMGAVTASAASAVAVTATRRENDMVSILVPWPHGF